MRSQIACAVAGIAGLARIATMRSASSGVAEHGVDGRAGLHLPRLVRLEVGVGRPHELPRRLQRAARLHDVPRRDRGGDGVGGGRGERAVRPTAPAPVPPHFDVTTVATRAVRLPRLLARSAL